MFGEAVGGVSVKGKAWGSCVAHLQRYLIIAVVM